MAIQVRILRDGTRRYRAKVFRELSADGKREEVSKTFQTKKEAQRWEREQRAALDQGTYVEPCRHKLYVYMRGWLDGPMVGQVRTRTLQDYSRALERVIKPLWIGNTELVDLTPSLLKRFYGELMATGAPGGGPLGPRSVRYVHGLIRAALRQAVEDRKLLANPASGLRLPRATRTDGSQVPEAERRWQALSAAQVRALLETSARAPSKREGERQNGRRWTYQPDGERNRFHALWHVLVNGGLRPSEALGLKWDAVSEGVVHVRCALVAGVKGRRPFLEAPKTRASIRTVTMPPATMQALAEHRGFQELEKLTSGRRYNDQGFVFANRFGGPLDLHNITKRHFLPLLEAAGLPRIRVYDLRHTHASRMLAAGVPIQVVSARMGHASVKLTLDVYCHESEGDQAVAVATYMAHMTEG